MQFEDISEYVYLHSQDLALTTRKPAYMSHTCADEILGPRQSGSCTRRHRRMLPRSSICSSTTLWLGRARRTTSPLVPSTISLASIHRSRSTSSKSMPLNSSQSMRVRRERPMANEGWRFYGDGVEGVHAKGNLRGNGKRRIGNAMKQGVYSAKRLDPNTQDFEMQFLEHYQ